MISRGRTALAYLHLPLKNAALKERCPGHSARYDPKEALARPRFGLPGRDGHLLSDGGSLLSTHSFTRDRSQDSRSKLIAWLIASGEIVPGLMEMRRNRFAKQIGKAIDDPSSGAAYEEVQRIHAIMSEMARALPKAR